MPVVAIVGATGKTGRWALKGAIERELEVRVLARSPDKLAPLLADLGGQSEDLEKITVVEGSVTDADKLETLMDGADVVMSFLGMTNPPEWVVSPGVEAVMGALLSLRKAGKTPPRFLSMSSIVLGDSAEQGRRAWGCFVAWLVPKVALKACFEDMQAAEDYILANRKAMGLSVTILRATVLKTSSFVKDYTDPVKTYKLVPVSDTAAKLSFFVEMQSVCEAFLDVATTGEYEDAEVSVFAA
ncbi:hypothetical protein EMIHUDRAFT_457844 [Emiliania huxleyi CCMP1516]|uniref:NAD(P)-binding domain-containing protein n=2 Tax=Emiliania huxleyi TaxID=2903 RepID=A0A0D3JK09_EMIH1|nr:hypothetical protein EMIHUDRAFT_457844 [Emiliania huxleyi CCMP1516]EOD23844.1 hypothetical protein EMIHUDRAFT_457844 [Emiliania huxleyi CCMP1516]|eukprot:XP_005776273.1 hypothetical protein EMIHUDRAFT_457844 [Emiliania huxleyi CCMP1516]